MINISIIIPVYNVEKYIDRCLQSVVEQDIKHLEIICVEDGSKDNSLKILKQWAAKDKRIEIFENSENKGLSYSRNIGLERAKGKYVYFIDSDDKLSVGALKKLYKTAEEYRTDILFCRLQQEFETEELENIWGMDETDARLEKVCTGEHFFISSILNKSNMWNCCVPVQFYRRTFLMENHLFFKNNIIHEDLLFSFQAILLAKRVFLIPDELYIYIRRSGSITTSELLLEKRVMSLCSIINDIYLMKYGSGKIELEKAICQYLHGICNTLYMSYLQIDSFSEDNFSDIRLLSLLTFQCYGGYFSMKLPKDVMRKIRSFDTVYIYGAGKVGQGLLQLLIERNVHVAGFVVTNKEGVADIIENIVVNELTQILRESLLLIATKSYDKEMEKNARELGFENVISVKEFI